MGLRFLAIACLVGAALAGPLQKQSRSQCSSQCSRSFNQKFDYEIGKAYTYEYRGENEISVAGKPKQKATIEGLAVLTVVDRCEMILQLQNLRIQQKLSPEEIEDLTQKLQVPLPFAFQDGKVENVCPGQEEDMQSLNIKKGLISAFINTMSKLDTPQEIKEYDSLGNCQTKYTVKYVKGLEIQKEKSLKSCSNRHSSVTAFITNPYESPDSKLHTLPIFPDEKLVCKQFVEDKIIKSVECTEEARIKPLQKKESVIQFEGQLKLTLLSVRSAQHVQTPSQSSQEPILYSLQERKDVKSQERETEQLLREMCSKNQQSMDVTVSKDFIKLVTLVKSLPYSSLSKLHSSMKDGRICSSKKVRDLFVDTLPMSGTHSAIKLMVELLEKKEISGLKAKLWPASLALIPNPTRETLAEIIPLLKEQPSAVVLLGVSAMVHRYCSHQNCDNEPAVQEITSILQQQLREESSEENESKVLAILKAFGNMGYHGDAEKLILSYAQNKSKPTRLRLAAIDAFRRIHQKRPEELIRIYEDAQELSEIRIAALSSVMKQADEQQLRQIKRTAEQETDEQVSGYASSLIKNMRKSSSPLKKSVKRSLEQIEIKSPKVNYWTNSKNIELSTFSETFNVGGSIETDIVHSSESKLPRSITTRFDADILNNNMNIFEIGVRAEGFEAILKNLIGLKDKIPKHPSWNILSADKIFGADAEASAFIRTMNTEIFDLSASDMSAVGEMVKIADLVSQLAQGKSSDFSHSFLFLNSELVIPSVTGRAYSFAVTGSATLGLTASTKLDFLRFPRHADARAHFQPSFNVELSTTVGIQSSQHRPDVKLITGMHLESDVAAQFKIKDGHLVIANLSLPSENVVRARVSSDIVEIDAHHNEKPVFEVMQKKIDYCFDKLQKPLGLAVCGMLEVPKPFIRKSFPFINGVGSIEFAIKKADREMRSYEIVLERPRHHSPVQKFKASFDTPGSRTARKFAAEVLVSEPRRGQKEVSVELVSPFKSAGGKGSLTSRDDLLQGAFELHSSSSPLISANISAQISSSRAKKVVKPLIKVVIGEKEPMQVGGVVSITNGRKQLISIDIQTNKPSRKLLSLKGTITKEGSITLSKKAEWKISSDLSVDVLLFDARVRSTVEKQSKQAQTISASLQTDYRQGSRAHSMKLSGLSQKSSAKLSTNAQFQSTQYPAASWALKWEMQGQPMKSLKNDLMLKYGLNMERSFISIKQHSKVSDNEASQCSVAVRAPELNIDSEISVEHELKNGAQPQYKVAADLRYTADKHIKALLNFNTQSKRPLKANSRAELEYPGGKLTYVDEIDETETDKFKGKARVQWRENKKVELEYIYQILTDASRFHHEVETSIKLSSRPRPIQSKVSVKVERQALHLEASVRPRPESVYLCQANLNKIGMSHIKIQTPVVESNLKLRNEESSKALDVDMRVKTRLPRRILASASAQLGKEKSLSAEMSWDADRQPEQKVSLLSKLETKGSRYLATGRLQVADIIKIALIESGERRLLSKHEGSLEASLKDKKPIKLEYSHELSEEEMNCALKFSQNNIEKFEAKLDSRASKSAHGRELLAKASLKSLDNSFESKKLQVEFRKEKSGSSTELKTLLHVQRSSRNIHRAEMAAQYNSEGIELRASVNTPHKLFSQQSAIMKVRKSENTYSSSLTIEMPENKIISISSEVEKKNKEISSTITLKSPFDIVRDAKVHISLDNHRSKKSIFSYLDVNRARLGDIEATMIKTSTEVSVKTQLKVSPIPNVPVQGLTVSVKKSRASLELSAEVQLQGDKQMALEYQLKQERSGITLKASLDTPFRAVREIRTSLKQSRSLIELSASSLYSNDKKVEIKSQILRERSKVSATVTLQTPYKVKEAKAHFSVENQSSKKNLLAYIDSNGERQGDIEISYLVSSQGMEIQSRIKTVRTPEISSQVKVEKSDKIASLSAKIVKGSSLLQQSSRRSESGSLKKTVLEIEILRNSNRNSDEYSMKLAGPTSPLSLEASVSRRESSALNVEAKICREVHQTQCLKLKSVHKALRNSQGYSHYKQLSLVCEKSLGESSEKLGTAEMILTVAEHDIKSKVLVEYKEQKIGYEARIHKREHDEDHCSFDSHIFMPSQTARVKASVMHSSHGLLMEIEAIPDSSRPEKKLGLEIKKDHRSNQEQSGYIKLSLPKMEKPILLTCRVQREGLIPVQGKWELQYSSLKGSRQAVKSLTLELESKSLQRSSGKKSVALKLYSEDKKLDASLELRKEISREQNSYEYEWNLKTQAHEKKGGASIKLSHRPRKIHISYYTPSIELKVQAQASQSPADISVTLSSRGKLVKEITFKTSENCIEMDVQRSGPLFKSALCVNKQVGNAVKFVSLEAHCHHKKCLEISIGIDPSNPSFMDVKLQWKKNELAEALSEASGLSQLLKDRSLEELERELKTKLNELKNDVIIPALRDLVQRIKHLKQEKLEQLKELLKRHHQMLKNNPHFESLSRFVKELVEEFLPMDYIRNAIIQPVVQSLRCLMDTYFQLALKHIPDVARIVMDVAKEQLEHCMKKFCVSGTFCHDLVRAYERRGMKEAKKVFYRKVQVYQKKVMSGKYLPTFWNDITKAISDVFGFIYGEIEAFFRQVVEGKIFPVLRMYYELFEDWFKTEFKAFVEYVVAKIENILNDAEKDEDFRTAKSLLGDILKKIQKILNHETIQKILNHELIQKIFNKETIQKVFSKETIQKIKEVIQKIFNKETIQKILNKETIQKILNKEMIQKLWERSEPLLEEHWEPLKKNLIENSKKLLKGKVEVTEFDTKRGSIELRVRHPLSQQHVQLLRNMITAAKQKLQQSVSE